MRQTQGREQYNVVGRHHRAAADRICRQHSVGPRRPHPTSRSGGACRARRTPMRRRQSRSRGPGRSRCRVSPSVVVRGGRWRSLLLSTACAGQLRVSLCAGRKQAPGRARQSPRTSTTGRGSGGTSGRRTCRSGTPDAEFRSCTLGCPPDTSQDRVDGRCDKTLVGLAPPTRNVCDATSTRSCVRIIHCRSVNSVG